MQIELVSQPDVVIARWRNWSMTGPGQASVPIRDRPLWANYYEPPPGFGHVSNVAKITSLLNELLPDGRAFSNPVLTLTA